MMKSQKMFMGLLAALLAVFLVVPAAQAVDISIGGGPGYAPDYEGSSDYELVPVPFASITWANGMYFRLEGLTAKFNLMPSAWASWLHLGPMYNYRAQRSDLENNQVDAMNSVSDANEVGGFVAVDYNNFYLTFEALADMGNAHDGWHATLSGGYNWNFISEWTLTVGAFTTYANEDYMETYFGVDANNVGASGFAFYDPDGGMKDVGVDLGLNWNFTQGWDLRGLAKISRLVGDADDDSPLVDEGSETQFFGTVLLVWSF